MKAIPVPPKATLLTSFPVSYAKLPKIEKIVKPAKRLVPVSAKLTIVESLQIQKDKKIQNYYRIQIA